MGRGTAILRFGSALHSRRFPGPSAQRLVRWLEMQLDMRGVDPALYSRYIISLLQLDDAEFERSEISDHELENRGASGGGGGKKSRRKRQQQQRQPQQQQQQRQPQQQQPLPEAAIGVSSRKRAAAVRCLQSACSDPYEVDELIDELCYRLKRLNNSGGGGATAQRRPGLGRQQLPPLDEEAGAASASAATDSGRAGTPEEAEAGAELANVEIGLAIAEEGDEEEAAGQDAAAAPDDDDEAAAAAAPNEDYGCAFPALARAEAEQLLLLQQRRLLDERRHGDSAWARGPPRGLATPPGAAAAAAASPDDEGFLDVEEDEDDKEDDDLDDDGDAVSVASEGSEILQLVSHILHSFNRELEDEMVSNMAASSAAASAASAAPDGAFGGAPVAAAAAAASPDDDCDLVPALTLLTDGRDEVLSDHDFDDLPSQEDAEEAAAASAAAAEAEAEAEAAAAVAAAALPPVAMATGILTLPEEVVLTGMASWSPLDRLRHQMWSRKPLPPRPLPSKPSPTREGQGQGHHQAMSQLEKSKRACSFLLRGHCKKDDCEFAHDLTRVACKFWSAGECFKGDTCPFLHVKKG